MSSHPPRSLTKRFYIVLGILIIGGLFYQNFILYSISKNLRRSQMKLPPEMHGIYTSDEVSRAVAVLVNENAIYRANLKQRTNNLRECMARLPQHEVDAFYKKNREDLGFEEITAPQ